VVERFGTQRGCLYEYAEVLYDFFLAVERLKAPRAERFLKVGFGCAGLLAYVEIFFKIPW